ncbi:triose-phosphate isomerase [Sphingobacteriales bacterium UPWRP_1]|nr:triose-phosphate isomerase [Sphingobacteriales bacterium TSM_CSM]PSJ76555.1 triose-phosphate isomerase [Sphingobacteriales bacterium UPWRP_1]
MRKKMVAGNWKMNKTLPEAVQLTTEINQLLQKKSAHPQHITVLCPPFLYLQKVQDILTLLGNTTIKTGAQNCHQQEQGAFTGEVSAPMLQSLGVEYVIIGHSERREYFNETNAQLKEKTDAALRHHLLPIFCCGEKLAQREENCHFETVRSQIAESLFHLTPEDFSRVIIAYEPVWAIGTGKTATTEQAQEMHAFIRAQIATKYGAAVANETTILYGGSCNAANAKALFEQPDVDGGLIGGASLKAPDFAAIVNSLPQNW